jgi:hypothetical protein
VIDHRVLLDAFTSRAATMVVTPALCDPPPCLGAQTHGRQFRNGHRRKVARIKPAGGARSGKRLLARLSGDPVQRIVDIPPLG